MNGFEFDACLQPGSGMTEALDAAGVDCCAPAFGEEAGNPGTEEGASAS